MSSGNEEKTSKVKLETKNSQKIISCKSLIPQLYALGFAPLVSNTDDFKIRKLSIETLTEFLYVMFT